MGKFVDDVLADKEDIQLDPVTPTSHPVPLTSHPDRDRITKQVLALDVESRSHLLVLGFETESRGPIRLLGLSPPAAVLLMKKLRTDELEEYLGTSLG